MDEKLDSTVYIYVFICQSPNADGMEYRYQWN